MTRSCLASGAIGEQLKEQSLALWSALNQRGILLPALFVFLWQATPTADTAFFYFETNKLGFKPEFLGEVRLVGSVASLAGTQQSKSASLFLQLR